jgi:hypothetical protein
MAREDEGGEMGFTDSPAGIIHRTVVRTGERERGELCNLLSHECGIAVDNTFDQNTTTHLTACEMAAVQPVHLGATMIEGVNQLMCHRDGRRILVRHSVLA